MSLNPYAQVARLKLVPDHPPDAELLRRVRERDGEALLVLYRRYHLRVFSLILRILGDRGHAEEVLQDVFQRLWDKPEAYQPEKGHLLAWLLTVARNLSLDLKRKESRRATYHVYPDENSGRALDAESIHAVRQALAELPEAQRQAIEMAYFEGLTHPEMAYQLGEALGTVKTRIRLGMQKLKDSLKLATLALL